MSLKSSSVNQLLRDDIFIPIPGENPSGADLRHDTKLLVIDKIKEARRQDDDLEQGVWQRERKTADWRLVIELAQETLATTSKNLQVAAYLTEALLQTERFAGLRKGLDLVYRLLTEFWDTVYPVIDPEDPETRGDRATPLAWMNTQLDFPVRSTPINYAGHSTINYKDSRLVGHEDQVKTDKDRKTRSTMIENGKMPPEVFDKAFNETPKAFYAQAERDLDACLDLVGKLDVLCDEKLEDDSPGFGKIKSALTDVRQVVYQLLDKKREKEPDPVEAAPELCAEESVRLSAVDFTLTAPGLVAQGIPFEMFVWAHSPEERNRVLARSREELRTRDILARTKGPIKIPFGTILTVRLRIPGAIIQDSEDTMAWEGESTYASFVVTLPELSGQTRCYGLAHIYVEGISIAKISFVLSATNRDVGILSARAAHYQTAFASYASEDRDAVLGRIQGIRKVAPELDVFLDVMSLRSGQNWEQELWRVIPASDIFYLFWSTHAKRSEWVEKEWRCALRERGIGFIDPIPLQSPEESPPPQELSSLHFNDWMLSYRRRSAK